MLTFLFENFDALTESSASILNLKLINVGKIIVKYQNEFFSCKKF